MARQSGPRRSTIIGKLLACCLALFCAVASARAEIVKAENYKAFWLWAGVQPQPALQQAQEIYLLAGEVTGQFHAHIISQRSAAPHLIGPKIWVVYRAQTIEWNDVILNDVLAHLDAWNTAGNNIAGLQIDFDAGTKHLENYAAFLSKVRARLPSRYQLGVTGLLDWSAHDDPKGLQALSGTVDEVVVQIYQGRHVIPGYEAYLAKLAGLKVNFKIGLLQDGDWVAPQSVENSPFFKGYVVFLLNPKP
ncbi:MAG: DUF3142 domain-containing protein [Aestuariivirga sp.]